MSEDLGKLLGRLVLGVLVLFHGVHKLLNGIDPVKHLVTGHHLPAALSYGVYVGELLAPALIVIGLFSRVGGALVVIDLLVALYLNHTQSLLAINTQGGYALELQMFYLFGGLGVALLGAGRFSVGGADGPLN